MTDLTDQEQANVRAAMRFLAIRCGGWKILAAALGLSKHTVRHVQKGEKGVSARMALRVARLASVPVDSLLDGDFPSPGSCPYWGHHPAPRAS